MMVMMVTTMMGGLKTFYNPTLQGVQTVVTYFTISNTELMLQDHNAILCATLMRSLVFRDTPHVNFQLYSSRHSPHSVRIDCSAFS